MVTEDRYALNRIVSHLARELIVWACLAACLGTPLAAQGQSVIDPVQEANVKAVNLYAFGRYISWPSTALESQRSGFVIGVMGDHPILGPLQKIAAKKTIQELPIVVRRVVTPSEASGCHILFIARSVTSDQEAALFKHLAGQPILFVGESPGFAQRGGTINFYVAGGNVRFELNPDQALQAHLSINAKMHSLGTAVK